VSSLSARRLTAVVVLLVVTAVLAVFWLTPSAGAAVSHGAKRASGSSPTAVSSAARRPSPRVRKRKVKKAPRALAAVKAARRSGSRERRRVPRRRWGTTEG
jgi:hypothetical protein